MTSRYTNDKYKGVKVVATKKWKKGEIIRTLTAQTSKLTEYEMEYLKLNGLDFSVTLRKGSDCLMLGPLAFVNHNCNPNCEIYTLSENLQLKVQRDIEVDDEVTWSYGREYFNKGECQCNTCIK